MASQEALNQPAGLAGVPRSLSDRPMVVRWWVHFSQFMLHKPLGAFGVIIIFLVVWWLLSGRPSLRDYLSIRTERAGEAVMTGFAVGFGGWLFTLAVALLIGLILTAAGLMPKNPQPSPMIGYMASMAIWKKVVIVFSPCSESGSNGERESTTKRVVLSAASSTFWSTILRP